MTTITDTCDLPGWHRWHIVRDESEAAAIASGRTDCYLYRSNIIEALYLLVPEGEE